MNNDMENRLSKPKVALIFDDMGASLQEIKEVYALKIPLTISVIPGLKFSKNVAYIGYRCGYSVLIHLPMEPERKVHTFLKGPDKFIGRHLTNRQIDRLLRHYLNYIRIAIGVNNHMGSKATQDWGLMERVLTAVKKKNLVFIDSRTSRQSVACRVAKKVRVICESSQGFLDSTDDAQSIKERLYQLLEQAKQNGKIIIIAHPKANTIKVLKEELVHLKRNFIFLNLKDYLEL
jgi:hypothetical protein